MGKMKKHRSRPARSHLTSVLSPHGQRTRDVNPNSSVSADKVGGAIIKLVEQLQSGQNEERDCACLMIAGMIGQPGAADQILRAGAVRVLAPLILDNKEALQLSALGALRNLSTEGSGVCEAMIQQDVMTSVLALLQKLGQPAADEASKDSRQTCMLQVVHLLWNLCENSELAVQIFSREDLIRRLLPCLDATAHGVELAVIAAQCLYTVSEDNAVIANQVAQDREAIAFLNKVVSHSTAQAEYSYLLLTVLTTGLLYNLSVSQPGSPVVDLGSSMQVLARTLELDTSKLLQNIQEALRQSAEANQNGSDEVVDMSEEGAESEDHKGQPVLLGVDLEVKNSHVEKLVTSVCDGLTAQRVALEIVANCCCCEEGGDEEWEDVSNSESIGEGDTAEGEVQMDAQLEEPTLSSEIHSLFISHNILPKVLAKIEPPSQEICKSLSGSYGDRMLSSIREVRERGLFCLSNLASNLPVEALGGVESLQRVWTGLGTLVTAAAGEASSDLLEAATSAMRAVTPKLAHVNPAAFSGFSSSDLQFLVSLGQDQSAEIRVNAVNIMASIGQVVAKQQPPPAIVKDIGVFLVCTVQRDAELWVQAEALDGIFDVFSEDHLDAVTQEIGLLPRLRQMVPTLKSRVNQERHSLGEHLPVVMTARTNLMRFIKYKSKACKQ